MSPTGSVRTALKWTAAGVGLVAGAYATHVGVAWSRYGHAHRPANPEDQDALLDRFMPDYEVSGHHGVGVAAPAAITFGAAREMDLFSSPVVRAIIRGRELVLGSTPDDQPRPRGLVREMQALGWGVLAEVPDREIVMGAVTQPWKADVIFQKLPPDEFATFHEAWLREDRVDASCRDPLSARLTPTFRTETRAVATDTRARERFRWYWSLLLPRHDADSMGGPEVAQARSRTARRTIGAAEQDLTAARSSRADHASRLSRMARDRSSIRSFSSSMPTERRTSASNPPR